MDWLSQTGATIFDWIENSPWFLAGAIVMANYGFNLIEENKEEKKYDLFKSSFSRLLIIFSLVFSTTKMVKVSLVSTVIYALLVYLIEHYGIHKKIFKYFGIRRGEHNLGSGPSLDARKEGHEHWL